MAPNETRRRELTDAAIRVLAREGARGLTHRAVDRAAEVPQGTASNYFRTRGALIAGLVERIGERIAPAQDRLDALARLPRDRAAFAEYLRYIVERLMDDPDVALALFELRIESTRRPEVAAVLHRWSREGFAADVEFNRAAGLPGGAAQIALFHYAIDGLLLDRLTGPIDPATSTDEVIDALVDGLLPER